jgi:tRNA/tmRNA/rRNA uracil-C5-methylase (TrmA/RlmC/RlmD family)
MTKTENWLGRLIELEIEKVAHGGIFVARHDNRVVFVSNVAPGEKVLAKVFEDRGGSFCRAEPIKIIQASPERVPHVWKEAGVGGAGGAEFGHLKLSYQRVLKSQVLAEALHRMAGLEVEPEVQPVPGDDEKNGLGYRTRVQLQVSEEGIAGPYRERSHDVVPVKKLPLANTEINELGLHLKNWQDVKKIEIASSSTGGIQWSIDKKIKGDQKLTERASSRSFRISGRGFWQVHHGAADLLAENIIELARAVGFSASANNLDLYSGVGLFSGALASAFGKEIRITGVESSKTASADAASNLVDLKNYKTVAAPVESYLRSLVRQSITIPDATVILDPPRSGAGKEVIENILAVQPKAIIYVACDPVALARDLKQILESGFKVHEIRAFDLFPHTHHFETIASLVRK